MEKTKSFQAPAEWTSHEACWVAWPTDGSLWQENLKPAQDEFTHLCRGITTNGGEKLEVLTPDETAEKAARQALSGLPVRFHRIPFGDIWLRDTAPIFVSDERGAITAAQFRFNGWGGKYVLDHDAEVSGRIAESCGLPGERFDFILEGGSVELDGEGTCLTTRQCLLNPNRNPSMNQASIEAALKRSLGATKVLWLGDGLLNDHTDGHIDTIARFIAPATVVCMEARESSDPNRKILDQIAADLRTFKDAKGRALKVIRIPSPGKIVDEDGRIMPASYVNFYIGNKTVVVPTYGSKYDAEAVELLAKAFPGRQVRGSSARAILSGGGAFHCITQQQPSKGVQ